MMATLFSAFDLDDFWRGKCFTSGTRFLLSIDSQQSILKYVRLLCPPLLKSRLEFLRISYGGRSETPLSHVRRANALRPVLAALSPPPVVVYVQSHNHIRDLINNFSRLANSHFTVQGGVW
jgi:hypothetical protein